MRKHALDLGQNFEMNEIKYYMLLEFTIPFISFSWQKYTTCIL